MIFFQRINVSYSIKTWAVIRLCFFPTDYLNMRTKSDWTLSNLSGTTGRLTRSGSSLVLHLQFFNHSLATLSRGQASAVKDFSTCGKENRAFLNIHLQDTSKHETWQHIYPLKLKCCGSNQTVQIRRRSSLFLWADSNRCSLLPGHQWFRNQRPAGRARVLLIFSPGVWTAHFMSFPTLN